jgi:mono/diheme cytochrome c family protein
MLELLYDDLGGLRLESDRGTALPWPLLAAALVRDRSNRIHRAASADELAAAFTEFGFLRPDTIGNAPGLVPVRRGGLKPIGIVSGVVDRALPSLRVDIANITCAACHVGTTYDAAGNPTRVAWVGLPNTSIDLDGFSTSAYRGLKSFIDRRGELMAVIDTLFPSLDAKQRRTLERMILPRVELRLRAVVAGVDAPVTFRNGGPGMANPAASMKYQIGQLPGDRMSNAAGFGSIPDLSFRHLRSSLLYDGGYGFPGRPHEATLELVDATDDHLLELARVASIFSTPVVGVPLVEAPRNVRAMNDVMHFVREYRPQPFPGPIDARLARRGSDVYAASCAQCHGDAREVDGRIELASFPNRRVPVEWIGTDGTRAAAADSLLVQTLRTAYLGLATVDSTGAYVAPPLSGIWATAPYLHNGSVPTLWHLMHPDQRPQRFYAGGHRLDFARVGIDGDVSDDGTMRYREGYRPWSTPRLYDTREPGRGNAGHERPFADLSEADKRALLEYLKRF